jgi:hypothetical protein
MLADNGIVACNKPTMETKPTKKKGRPAKAVKTKVLYMRIPEAMIPVIKEQVKQLMSGEEVDQLVAAHNKVAVGPADWGMVKKDKPDEAVLMAADDMVGTALAAQERDMKALLAQRAMLLEDVDKVTKERDELLVKRENWLRATDDQKTSYWRDRALKAEAYALKKAEEQ